MLVGLATLALGILCIVLLIRPAFSLPDLVGSVWYWFFSFSIVWTYSYVSLMFTVTVEQMGSVGRSGFALAIVGFALTLAGCFDSLFDSRFLGQPLSILGVSIPLPSLLGLLISILALFLLQHSTASWLHIWRSLPASFFKFVFAYLGYSVIEYVKDIVALRSLIGRVLEYFLSGASWVVLLLVLTYAATILFFGAAIVDLGRLLSLGKVGPFKHRVVVLTDGRLEANARISHNITTEPEPPIEIILPSAPTGDSND